MLRNVKEISPGHALSRATPFLDPAIFRETWSFYSVEQMVHTIGLAQHGMFEESVLFWRDRPGLRFSPLAISGEFEGFFRSRGLEPDARWILGMPDIYRTVMWTLLENRETPFAEIMEHIQRDHGQGLTFMTTEYHNHPIWSSGYRVDRAPTGVTEPSPNGFNVYGEILGSVYHDYFYNYQAARDRIVGIGTLLHKHQLLGKGFRRTTLVISDSTFRHVKEIQGGDVWYQTGFTCGRMAERIRELYGDVNQFRYIIVTIGLNDSKRNREEWRASFLSLCDILAPLRGHPEKTICYHAPIGFSPRVLRYNTWLREKFDDYLRAPNVAFYDWSLPSAQNPFVRGNGAQRYPLFDDDREHLNDVGLENLWCVTCSDRRFKDMRLVRFRTSTDLYTFKQLKDRAELYW